jgi:LPXTG-site transpeptidase (sortase) family protein
LLLVAGLLAGYIFISPVVPSIGFYFNKPGDATVSKNGLKILPVLEGYDQKTFSVLEKELSFKDNTLVIPTIGVESQIFTSSNSRVLRQGIWHREKTGSPDKGGNFVLAGHRFLYTQGKNTLYFLDKLKIGDQIFVFWEGRRYDYEVETSLVVPAGATEIEAIMASGSALEDDDSSLGTSTNVRSVQLVQPALLVLQERSNYHSQELEMLITKQYSALLLPAMDLLPFKVQLAVQEVKLATLLATLP